MPIIINYILPVVCRRYHVLLCFVYVYAKWCLTCCPIICLYALSFMLWCPLRHSVMFGSSLRPVVCRITHVLFMVCVFACIQWCPTHWLYEQHGRCLIRGKHCFPFTGAWVHLYLGEVGVAHHFSTMCCGFCFVCLRPMFCVSNVVSFSGLSILGVVSNSVFFNIYLKHCKDSWNQQIHSKLHGIHSSVGRTLCS